MTYSEVSKATTCAWCGVVFWQGDFDYFITCPTCDEAESLDFDDEE
jgi:uncharacterized Zn finger protein (UPF0148 family)